MEHGGQDHPVQPEFKPLGEIAIGCVGAAIANAFLLVFVLMVVFTSTTYREVHLFAQANLVPAVFLFAFAGFLVKKRCRLLAIGVTIFAAISFILSLLSIARR